MIPWLSVVGIGEDGLAGLSATARALIDDAEVLVGGERHLALVPSGPRDEAGRQRLAWPNPLSTLVERIAAMRGGKVCVLATGDPMFFGIGALFARHVAREEMQILPGISAFTLAAARLAWPLERTALITLHGRPIETLARHVAPGASLLVLAENATTTPSVCAWLTARGFGDSRVTALAHMGGPKECRFDGLARSWSAVVPDFHTIAVECVAGPNAIWHPDAAGLPDDAFEHDGKLTKRAFRALALAKLMPHPGALLWDIGAGCGSVGIEWLRAARNSRAIALEPQEGRRAMAARNSSNLGVPSLDIRDATAPDALAALPPPDAVFIGGGLSDTTLTASMQHLKPGGRIVAHAVTLQSEAILLAAYQEHGGELVRLSVAQAEPIGAFSGWRPAMPVTQWAWVKA